MLHDSSGDSCSCGLNIVTFLFSDMALPFETQSMEERIQDRAKRARDRETWHRVTREDKLTYNMAAFIADEKDAREEAIIALGEKADGPLKAKMYCTPRSAKRGSGWPENTGNYQQRGPTTGRRRRTSTRRAKRWRG